MTTAYSSPTPTRANAPGRTVSIVGIVLGALGLLFSLLLGLPGLICSIVGAAKGNRLGYIGIVVSIACTAAGMAIGMALVHR
ncbi:MAG TPA: hypothetical protein VHE83_15940 [Mycobacteriales bacterium]|nr:hypothetical protein [Mycobacteriales bacterium]